MVERTTKAPKADKGFSLSHSFRNWLHQEVHHSSNNPVDGGGEPSHAEAEDQCTTGLHFLQNKYIMIQEERELLLCKGSWAELSKAAKTINFIISLKSHFVCNKTRLSHKNHKPYCLFPRLLSTRRNTRSFVCPRAWQGTVWHCGSFSDKAVRTGRLP